MTFLQLVTSLKEKCGATGTIATVVNPTGEWGRLCNWTIDAWNEIQALRQDWEWMRTSCTFVTIAHQNEYTAAQAGVTSLGSWKKKSFRAYLTSSGYGTEQTLNDVTYNKFRNNYLLGSRRGIDSRPTSIATSPGNTLLLGDSPDAVYTVSGEYYKSATALSVDASTPDMPSRFHMMIVYFAMMKYGAYESASEVYDSGKDQYTTMKFALMQDQLPEIERR